MVRRSHKRRKRFACGHLGFGRTCYRCLALAFTPPVQVHRATTRRQWRSPAKLAKHRWQQSFANDPIDLTHLPKPIVIKTRQILAALDQGISPGKLQGKRFQFDRTLLRIPVTYRYRLFCRWYGDRIVPLQVLTHEAYNAVARNRRKMK